MRYLTTSFLRRCSSRWLLLWMPSFTVSIFQNNLRGLRYSRHMIYSRRRNMKTKQTLIILSIFETSRCPINYPTIVKASFSTLTDRLLACLNILWSQLSYHIVAMHIWWDSIFSLITSNFQSLNPSAKVPTTMFSIVKPKSDVQKHDSISTSFHCV